MKRQESPERSTVGIGRSSGLPHWAVTGVFVASLGAAVPVVGQVPSQSQPATQSATRSFLIAGGPLAEALAEFTRQTGITVLDPEALARNATTQGVTGEFTNETALRSILASTGVAYRFTNPRSIRLEAGQLLDPNQPGRSRA
jgi:hypothetical protein